jgi:hypothetical protein
MNFAQCIRSAIDQNAISQKEGEDLLRRFEELRAQFGLDLDGGAASTAARDALAAELKAEGIEARRRAGLMRAAKTRVDLALDQYRNAKGEADQLSAALRLLENFGFSGFSSVEGKTKAIIGMAHAQMEEALAAFDRTAVAGARMNKPLLREVVSEMHGMATGNARAKTLAAQVADVFEALRQRFNAAGGQIGKLENYLPQHHDPAALLSAGRETWKAEITPLLDLERMRDPLTGKALTPAQLDHLLDVSWKRIVTDGWIDRDPAMMAQGRGALAGQRAEHRVLHFKGPDEWMRYAEAFGNPDPFAAMMMHIRGMAKDVAALETLGPNPGAMVEYLKQKVRSSQAEFVVEGTRNSIAGDYLIDNLWKEIRGTGLGSPGFAGAMATIRSLLTASQLGTAIATAVVTDPAMANMARRLTGLPTKFIVKDWLDTFRGASQAESIRAGLILDSAMHVMNEEARYAGSLSGRTWANWLADRTLTWSGLSPWTQARRHLFGMEFQATIHDALGTGWDALDPRLRRTMEGYGLSATDWATLNKAERHQLGNGAGILRPNEVAALDRGLAERYLEMIVQQTERAVPSGTKLGRAVFSGGTEAGTVTGELARSFLQYKGFGLSVMMLQAEAIAQETAMGGKLGGARYAGALLLTLTLGGAAAIQLRALAMGKDPQPMDDYRFWIMAAKSGGGFGLFGDFLFAEHGRFGHSFVADLMGPTAGLVEDVAKATLGNVAKAAQGESDVTGDFIKMGRRYAPPFSSLVYTRAAWNRIVMDQLEYLANPDAHRKFRDQERRLRREFDQGFYWPPGSVFPERAPDPRGLSELPFLN